MDVLEAFCTRSETPIKDLNILYNHLTKKMISLLNSPNLKTLSISIYKPIKGDLYTAESEWEELNMQRMIHAVPGPSFNWDEVIKPNLYQTHSQITNTLNVLNDENVHEQINIEKKLQEFKENKKTKQVFYITKKNDNIIYKGNLLKISKNNDPYRVFCALYSKLKEGGYIPYKDFIPDIRKLIPKTKKMKDTEVQTFITSSLTDTSNGFMKYLDPVEDNQKPLIEVRRGLGIDFNNTDD